MSKSGTETKHMIRVHLVETPAPPKLKVKRLLPQIPTKSTPSYQPITSSSLQTPKLQVLQMKPTSKVSRPIERRVLYDHRATNSLSLRNYLKTVQRTSPSKPQLDIAIAPPISSKAIRVRSQKLLSGKTTQATVFSQKNRLLKAVPLGSKKISFSNVIPMKNIKPIYPHIAKKYGWEGTVHIRVVVKPNGIPGKKNIQVSSGHKPLDMAALNAVNKWRFLPAKDGNIPVQKIIDIPFVFKLGD